MRVVVLGATGAVGRGILSLLDERDFSRPQVVALASPRSEGQNVSMGDQVLTVSSCEDFTFAPGDLVFSAVDARVARRILPAALKAGARVIDKSSAYRDQAPLVVPEVNGDILKNHPPLVCSPNCVVIPLVMALAPLQKAFGLQRVSVSTYQAVSGAGKKGMDTLYAEMRAVMMAMAPEMTDSPFPRQIALNILPQIGDLNREGVAEEEDKIQAETRAILGDRTEVMATSVRVPVLIGHGLSVVADFDDAVQLGEARALLSKAPGCRLSRTLPTPMDAAGEDEVLIARLRQPSSKTLAFWVVCDNLRKGAALNAVHIAEALCAAKG
jgi:aspartate-semialdehyde dehydrogenase